MHVKDVVVVVSARVPVIRFKMSSSAVDLVFASVHSNTPPTDEELLQNDFLLKVTPECRPGVNGIRTLLEIQRRLPVPYDVYVCVLRSVKYWATVRQVYGKVQTFPNGVCLAIMVARVCQVYPSHEPSVLLRFFFRFFSHWMSGKSRIQPIFITCSLHGGGAHIPGMLPSWDPARHTDDLFPIINPAYPYVNSAHSLGSSSLRCFFNEILRASALLNTASPLSEAALPLQELWEPYNIFDEFSTFVVVHVKCSYDEKSVCRASFNAWKGYVESKLRLIVYSMECFVEVRPLPRAVVMPRIASKRRHPYHELHEAYFFGVKSPTVVLQWSHFSETAEEFQFAVREGLRGPNSFVPDSRVENKCWVSFLPDAESTAGL